MTGLYKSVALFLSALLVFTSISSGSHSLFPGPDLKVIGDKPGYSYSLNTDPVFIVFNNHGEKSLSPVKGVPETSSRYQPYDFANDCIYYGIRKYIASSRNISFSSSVDCSLSGCEIVFPFHNFW